jgi:integrator complex subunit 2
MRILKAMTTGSGVVKGGSNDSEDGENLTGFGVHWQLEAAMIKALIPNLLESSCPRCLQDQFCSWWQTLPSSSLEYLVPELWDIIRDPSLPSIGNSAGSVGVEQNIQSKNSGKKGGSAVVTLSSSGFAEEPLKFLACNVKVFRSPLLGIILDVLVELLITNRRLCQAAATEGGRDAGIKKEEVTAALVAQDRSVFNSRWPSVTNLNLKL